MNWVEPNETEVDTKDSEVRAEDLQITDSQIDCMEDSQIINGQVQIAQNIAVYTTETKKDSDCEPPVSIDESFSKQCSTCLSGTTSDSDSDSSGKSTKSNDEETKIEKDKENENSETENECEISPENELGWKQGGKRRLSLRNKKGELY